MRTAVTFLVVLANDVARHLGADVGVHVAIQRRHPLVVQGHVLLDGVRHEHLGIRQLDDQPTRSCILRPR